MKPEAISTPKAPGAIGPYSQAIRCGDWLFISGQIPLDPATGTMAGTTISQQTEQVMKNLTGILESQGLTLAHVVKTTVFLKNLGDFTPFNETYQRFLKPPYPARATIEISRLPKDALVEIEAIAYNPKA
jgi:2-iminobutanoate/2-iminopropanoate deaminase